MLSDGRADGCCMSASGIACVLRVIAAFIPALAARSGEVDRGSMLDGGVCGLVVCSGRGTTINLIRGVLARSRSVATIGSVRTSHSANRPCRASTATMAKTRSSCRSSARRCVAGSIRSRPCVQDASISAVALDLRLALVASRHALPAIDWSRSGVWLRSGAGSVECAVPSPLAGHAVNPSLKARWRHPCRHTVPQAARTPHQRVGRWFFQKWAISLVAVAC